MAALRTRLRADFRTGWRSWVALVLLLGTFGGVVLGVAAGARRTQTAFPHLLRRARASDALIGAFKNGAIDYYRRAGADPRVLDYGLMGGLPLFPVTAKGELVPLAGNVLAPMDGKIGRTIDRPLILDGRLPRPEAPRELLLNEVFARRQHAHVGSHLRVTTAEFDDETGELTHMDPPFTVTIVGIGRFPNEVVPTTKFDTNELGLMSTAAYRAYGRGHTLNFDGIFVRLRNPSASGAGYRQTTKALAAAQSDEVGGDILYADYVDRNARVERALRPQWMALALFAGFAAVVGFLVIGQALSRQLSDDATEVPILRTLGFTRADLVRMALLRTALVAGAAAVLAVVVAIAMSPLFPIGAARRALVDPGVDVNVSLLLAGAVVIVLAFVGRATVPAWRQASASTGVQGTSELSHTSTSALVGRVSAVLPVSAGAGVRMALEPGRGRTAVPVRTTLVGAVIALAAVATTATFAVNLDRVVSTPRLYGRGWDVLMDGDFGPIPRQAVEPVLRRSPAVASYSGGFYGEASVAGRAVTAVGVHGHIHPVIVAGRAPAADDEVVLGATTLDRAHGVIGARVKVDLGDGPQSMRVVGRAVFPAMGRGSFPQTGLGDGVLVTDRVLQPRDQSLQDMSFFNFYLIDLRPGVTAAQQRSLQTALKGLCPPEQDCQVRTPADQAPIERPAEITNLDRIRWTPVLLAGLLAALVVATVAHTLLTSIRRRRRDLALLKTIGFQRRQVSAAVAWQATTFAAASLLGLPVGLALGRVLWRALAEQLGIVPDVATPGLALLVAIPATLVLANLLAVVPGWLAGRVRPAVVLRSE